MKEKNHFLSSRPTYHTVLAHNNFESQFKETQIDWD